MAWKPSIQTQNIVGDFVEDLLDFLPEQLGIDKIIPGCEVISLDPLGVGLGVLPRFILCRINAYYELIFYRGNIPGIAVTDLVTVTHIRDGNLYEVLAAGGSGGAVGPFPIGTGANTQVTYWTGVNTIAGDAGMTYNAGTDTLTIARGLTLTGGANAVLTLNDNVANAHTVVDAGGIEYLRYITTNVQPVIVWNEAGVDVDFRWEASGVDPALFIQGSDGFVGIGTNSPTYRFDVEESTLGIMASFVHTSGSADVRILSNDNDAHIVIGSDTTNVGTRDVSVYFQDAGATLWNTGVDGSDSYKFKISQGAPGTNTRLTIVPGGNVGIGTESPGSLTEWNFADLDLEFVDAHAATSVSDVVAVVEVQFAGATGYVPIYDSFAFVP